MTVSFTSGQGVGTEVTIDIPITDDDILEEKLKTFFGPLVFQPTSLNVIVEPSRTEVVIVDDDSEGEVLSSLLPLSHPHFPLSPPLLPSYCNPSFFLSLIHFFPVSVLFAAYLSVLLRGKVVLKLWYYMCLSFCVLLLSLYPIPLLYLCTCPILSLSPISFLLALSYTFPSLSLPAVTFGLSPDSYTATEDSGSITFTVTLLNGTLGRDVEVSFTTANGTAVGKHLVWQII